MKPIVCADKGSWKVCMNTLVGQVDKMFSFSKPPMESNSTSNRRQPPCRKCTFPPFLRSVLDFFLFCTATCTHSCLKSLYFLSFLNPLKNRCVCAIHCCASGMNLNMSKLFYSILYFRISKPLSVKKVKKLLRKVSIRKSQSIAKAVNW